MLSYEPITFVWRKKPRGSIKSEACQNKAANCGKLHTRGEVFYVDSSCSPCFLTVGIFRPDLVIFQPSHLAVNRKFLFQQPLFVCFVGGGLFWDMYVYSSLLSN